MRWYSLRLLAMLILVQKENKQCQVHIFQATYSASFQIHQPGIKKSFEHTNHGIHVIFVFQTLDKLISYITLKLYH